MRSRGQGSTSRGAMGCAAVLGLFIVIGGVAAFLEDRGSTPPPSGAAEASPTDRPPSFEPEPTAVSEPTPLVVALRDALEADMVDMEARGHNLEQLDITLESNVEVTIEVSIEAGLLFTTRSAGVQPMIVITDTSLQIEPELSVEWSLDVACGSMNKDEPRSKDTFTLAAGPAKADVRRLVAVDAFHDADFRVQQFAIWTITNDPSRSGYVGLGIGGVGSGPTKSEMREIRALFKAAGIELEKYRALR